MNVVGFLYEILSFLLRGWLKNCREMMENVLKNAGFGDGWRCFTD